MKPIINGTKVVFGEVRFSYVHVFEAESINGSDAKYSCSLIIPKSDKATVAAISQAIEAAKKAGVADKWRGKEPAKLQLPLCDGDEREDTDEAYAGAYYLNAKCKTRPGVVGRDKMPIMDVEEFYSGCYGVASVTFYAYDVNGNKGVAAGLNNVMKTRDGDNLGGRVSAEADFAGVDFADEDDEL